MADTPQSSNQRSIYRTGQLFMEGAYSDQREWVDADEYRQLQRLHRQMCDIATERHDEIERLRAFITQWTYEGSLQTFEDRARFRTEAQRLLAAAAPESRDG